MAQTGFTPIQLYYSSTTTNVPLAADLANGELAINITDGKLFYKDNANAVQVIGWKTTPTSAGGTGLTSYTAGDTVYYASGTALSKLAIGANTTVMTSSGSAPQWTAQSALSVGTASNLLSNATSGVMQITGPAAASTRVMTIPNANFTAARTDAAQTFTGIQSFDTKIGVKLTDPYGPLEVSANTNELGIIRMTQRTTGGAAFGLDMGLDSGTGDIIFSRIVNNVVTEAFRIARASGVITMAAYGAGAATFSAAGVISSVSDETWKVKDGIPTDPDAMLKKLEPGYWYYNDEKKETFGVDRQLGFYAQNVNAAIGPEAAPTPEEGKPWGYYDRSVLAITVMSLQKAIQTIETLTDRIAALEAKCH